MNSIYNFQNDESGAVTVDWVVLTAAIVGIGISVIAAISGGVKSASEEIDSGLDVAANFTFSFDAEGLDFSLYSPLSSQHGNTWNGTGVDANGLSWAESTYASWSDPDVVSDAALVAMYDSDYQHAISGADATRADYIAVQEQIMSERGIDIPDGNLSAEQVREMYET